MDYSKITLKVYGRLGEFAKLKSMYSPDIMEFIFYTLFSTHSLELPNLLSRRKKKYTERVIQRYFFLRKEV